MTNEEILKTEYSLDFDTKRKNRMMFSFHKYGPIAVNYKQNYIEAIKSLEKRLDMYKQTGNTEFLLDIANFAMIEYMYPQQPYAHFKVLGDEESHIVGMGINEIKRFIEEDR